MARIADLLAAGRTFSIELSPPKTDAAQLSLGRTIAELEQLSPSFASVTYGAGGSTRERTRQVVTWIRNETAITPMAHLTCQSHTRADIVSLLAEYRDAGIENILALGGDPPLAAADARPGDYTYAVELIDELDAFDRFSIGVAAHPEVHPRSVDRATDRRHLAAKLRRADFAITQFFFDVEQYVRLVDELAALDVHKPVLPGIMPVTNLSLVTKMATLSGAAVPAWVAERLERHRDDADAIVKEGIEMASELCSALLAAGAPGLHFYTMNRSRATREIYANLGLPVA